ncbi:DNA alkylation repair protein [Priestia megaterium]|nr:DNA alkylation repair protein [Priestia megaterium]
MNSYIEPLVALYLQHANEQNAIQMQQYMRNKFQFLGIKAPERRELLKQFLTEHHLPKEEKLEEVLQQLWDLPQREFQATGLDLLVKMKGVLTKDHIPLLESLIIQKSWWDTVDLLASNTIGYLFQKYPEVIPIYAEKWINSENMWLQRTAILYQLKYKHKTDLNRLFRYIVQHAESEEFFIQKAIGWSLREYSKTNPEAVRTFISEHQLKPLSKREGLKHIHK